MVGAQPHHPESLPVRPLATQAHWDQWPNSIVIQLLRRSPAPPGPSHFRIANGKVGVWISQTGETTVAAGAFEGGLDLGKVWTAGNFLNGGNPETPIKVGKVNARITDEFVEIEVTGLMTKGNPEMLAFEWCNGEKVR